MRNAKRIGKKLLASFLCVTMTAGLLTGLYTYKNNKEVKAATTGFTSNDFLKCDGTSIKNNYGKGNMVVQIRADGLYRKVGCVLQMYETRKHLCQILKTDLEKILCMNYLICMKTTIGQNQILTIVRKWE